MRISLLVTTYNWKEALRLVLASAAAQSRLPDEIVVADDGSRSDTAAMLKEQARGFPVPLRHVWQEDQGFRAARSRNLGIAASRGDYIVLIDGDMLLHRHFIADHEAFAREGFFLQGGRLRASPAETARLFAGGKPRFSPWLDGEFDSRHDFKRRNALRCTWLARLRARPGSGRIMSCNMSFWRDDLLRVNGFDEQMVGYGS
ncbi:MAG TPA: glycosyltransferase family 2 protein, partial [Rhodanobacteraceae bacterium]|nr:glycosyltransferase family 2 protein [Rhodanobacteraceae bacterium]